VLTASTVRRRHILGQRLPSVPKPVRCGWCAGSKVAAPGKVRAQLQDADSGTIREAGAVGVQQVCGFVDRGCIDR